MYAGLNVSLRDIDKVIIKAELEMQDPEYNTTKKYVHDELEKFILSDGSLDASRMREGWFPQIPCDIFISHSHKDEDLAISFSSWLKQEFNLRCFIDSTVWGHCDKLLKKIDDDYCSNDDKTMYYYDRRNISTAHVHMLLMSALNMMVDNTECLLFLNTPNSIKPTECISNANESQTYSPWIYGELSFSKMARRRPLEEHRCRMTKKAFESIHDSIEARNMIVTYPAPQEHLASISADIFYKMQKLKIKNPHTALDFIYKNHHITDDRLMLSE